MTEQEKYITISRDSFREDWGKALKKVMHELSKEGDVTATMVVGLVSAMLGAILEDELFGEEKE